MIVPSPRVRPGALWIGCGLVVNAAVVVWGYVRPSAAADAPAFEYDTVWHFAVVRWILDTGDASSLNTGFVDGTVEGTHFYPGAWHAMVALAVQLTGSSISAAIHATVLVLLLVTWPIGIWWLFRTLFGPSRWGSAAVVAFAFLPAVFPIGFFAFGILYANFFAYCLVPAMLVVAIVALRRVRAGDWGDLRRRTMALVVTVGAIPVAVVFSQPNAAFTVLVILLPLLYLTLWDLLAPSRGGARRRWLRPLGVLIFTVVFVIAWVVVHDSPPLSRTVSVETWRPYQSMGQAIGEFFFFGSGTGGQLLLGLLLLAGIVWVVRNRVETWIVVSLILLGALFVIATSVDGGAGSIRNYFVGFWYQDATRITAASVMIALPLMGYAVDQVSKLSATPVRLRRLATVMPVILIAAVVIATVAGPAFRLRTSQLRDKSAVTEAQWLSPSESDFLREVSRTVPADTVIANNPFDGSAMAYGLYGVDVLFRSFPGNWMGERTPDQAIVSRGLSAVASDPEVCGAVDRLGIGYALTLEDGDRPVFGDVPEYFAGLEVTPETPGFEVVERRGDLVLYRLTACD